jgi:VIT1/CCC1 family predicted Fe2+/Mn2+ transporter
MRHSFEVGLSFGLTSGIITTLGLLVGLSSGTNSKLAVVGGILVIAIADSLSDAMGIHISEESENRHTSKEIWESTLSTFFCKFVIALSFVAPVLFLELNHAVWISIVWGFSLLSIFSYRIAKSCNNNALHVVLEHLGIGILVIVLAHYIGVLISTICF